MLFSCRTSVNNFYQGKVLDEHGKPLEGVTIFEEERKNGGVIRTDSTGYFRLDRSPDWLGTLIFIKEGYRTDSIPSIRRQAGEQIKYNFIENDTTIVKLTWVGMGNENHKGDMEKELIQKLEGEWAVRNDWQDSVLTFSNAKDKNFKQEIFPSYNTIIFNPKNKTVEVNTYGEFGDGTSAIQNLNISNSEWGFENGLLRLKFDYRDYSGQHYLKSTYSIERTAQELILKKKE